MSARSAYARKKATETTRARARSHASSDSASINDLPRDRHRERDNTGRRLPDHGDHISHSGSSSDGRRERHLNDPAYTFAPRPRVNTEDVSAIEKSGLRSVLDKKTDGVRKGLAKAFAFSKKERGADTPVDFRPESAATVRPTQSVSTRSEDHYDKHDAALPPARHRAAHPGREVRWGDAGDTHPRTTAEALPPLRRWSGAGRPVQRWNKLRKDPELWDPNGDVLIYLVQHGQSSQNPSFRLSSHIIEATESTYLITLLRDGALEDDMHIPPSPISASPTFPRHGLYANQQRLAPGGGGGGGFSRTGQPTPPGSEDSSSNNSPWDADGQVSYEMYFPTPPDLSPVDQLRHHATTRNLFALLYHASLVGFTLHQALSDLHARLEQWMPLTPSSSPPDPTTNHNHNHHLTTLLSYLTSRALIDIRNDPVTAVSLLAWCERSEVRWEEGWREAFLHAAGMYAATRLETCAADWELVTPLTRALLERVSLETGLRVQGAEERLGGFEFGDMWPAASSLAVVGAGGGGGEGSSAKAAMERLREFLVRYYAGEFGAWPPSSHNNNKPLLVGGGGSSREAGDDGGDDDDVWLTRTTAQRLQRDFAALYDYLVNRDVVWDESEGRASRKWMMVSASGNRGFEADLPDLPMTDMLVEFDNRHRFPHIPHPYPIVPEAIPPSQITSRETSGTGGSGGGGGIFGSKSSNKTATTTQGSNNRTAAALDRRVQLAYTEASNIYALGSAFSASSLVDAFRKFEKADRVGEVDPSVARRGRWVLIYGVLQTLASVAVDAPGVRYTEGVSYHLSARLRGVKVPPWKSGGSKTSGVSDGYEATHELSHCWTVPATWQIPGQSSSEVESDLEDGGISPVMSYGRASSSNTSTSGSRHSGQFHHFPAPPHNHHLSTFLTPPAAPLPAPRRSAAGMQRGTRTHHHLAPRSSSIRSSATTTTTTTTASSAASFMSTNTSASLAPSVISTASSRAPSLAPSAASVSGAVSVRSFDGTGNGNGNGSARAPSRTAAHSALPPLTAGEPPKRRLPARPDARRQQQQVQQQHASFSASVLDVEDEEGEGEGEEEEDGVSAWVAAVPGRVYGAGAVAVSAVSSKSGVSSRVVGRSGHRHGGGDRRGLSELDDLLDEVDVDGEMFVMSPAGYGGGGQRDAVRGNRGHGGARGARGGAAATGSEADADGVGPVIRDFDELGVMD